MDIRRFTQSSLAVIAVLLTFSLLVEDSRWAVTVALIMTVATLVQRVISPDIRSDRTDTRAHRS